MSQMSLAARSRLMGVGVAMIVAISADASASPQTTVALELGAAGIGADRETWDSTQFFMGAYGDVLFGRSSSRHLGIGPYAQVSTFAFDEIALQGGASVLVPVVADFPLVLSAGAYGSWADGPVEFEPGVAGRAFWGARAYNFFSPYSLSAGLTGEFRYGLGHRKETAIVIGAHLDAVALSLPFVLAFNALRGSSSETLKK